MKRLLPVTLVLLAVVAVIGTRAGWFHFGYSEARLQELDRDWAQVVGWAELPQLEARAEQPMTELALAWREAGEQADRAEFQTRFEELLAEGGADVPIAPDATIALLQLGKLVAQADDLDADRASRLLAFSRRLQSEGHMAMFLVGTALGKETLARCREDDSLVPRSRAVRAPQPGELFTALFRDYVVLHESQLAGTLNTEGEDDPLAPYAGADEFLERSTRAAMVQIAERYEALRNEPRRFGEVSVPEVPGSFELWTAATFRRPGAMARVMESLLQPDLDLRGEQWADYVDEWAQVLGS